MNALDRYWAPMELRALSLRESNKAQAEQSLADELRYWTEQAAKAEPNSDRWHECMDELDTVKTLMRKT